MKISPLEMCDGYKTGHVFQYPEGTEGVYSNWTPRMSRIEGVNKVVFFGMRYFIQEYLIRAWNEGFFSRPLDDVLKAYQKRINGYLGADLQSYKHIEYLHRLGYLPLLIKALPEGSRVDLRVPMLTICNTDPKCFWLTNFIESIMSNILWMPCTSATIAYEYRTLLDKYARWTSESQDLVPYQGHDFSLRGLPGLEAAALSGAGHLLSFAGTDSIPAVRFAEDYYGAEQYSMETGCSVPATEHSVMCAGSKNDELETYRRLINEVHPTGIVSIVSDQYDLWKVLTDYTTVLGASIMDRDGKVVFRPDSGDPVKILCGDPDAPDGSPAQDGVVEVLWHKFGGTENSKGYKELDPHVGAIYGDSITLERAATICTFLKLKGFASTNVVFGIGSYTYQYNTRDTFGFAMKSTFVDVKGEPREIYKDPVTDDGVKKSARGLIRVDQITEPGDYAGDFVMTDGVTWAQEKQGALKTVFKNGNEFNGQSFEDVRRTLRGE